MAPLASRVALMALLAGITASMTCNSEDTPVDVLANVSRFAPSTVSVDDAWQLFDRSVTSGHAPTERIHVTSADACRWRS